MITKFKYLNYFIYKVFQFLGSKAVMDNLTTAEH